MSTAQKIILNAGGLSLVLILFLTLILQFLPLFIGIITAICMGILTSVLYILFPALAHKSTKKSENAAPAPPTHMQTSSDEDVQKINKLLHMSDNRLLRLATVFPFILFRDTIVVEQKQVIIEKSNFFFSAQMYPISIKDILSPVVSTGVFFATFKLELGPGGFQQNPPEVHFLKKEEALRARRVIMGLIICDKEGVDLSKMSRDEVLSKVEQIGNVDFD